MKYLTKIHCRLKLMPCKLDRGGIIYHYFDGDRDHNGSPLRDVILENGVVISRARCMSRREIIASLATSEPHYGDGTYATCHYLLQQAHVIVQTAHGINPDLRCYRAVYRIREPESLQKFMRTGGVCRTIPEQKVYKNQVLKMGGPDDNRVQFLFVERRKGERWIRVRGERQ